MSLPGFSTSLLIRVKKQSGADGGLRSRGLLHGKQALWLC